eukprot:g30199.t1
MASAVEVSLGSRQCRRPAHIQGGRRAGTFGPTRRPGSIGSGCIGEADPKRARGVGGVEFGPVGYPVTSVASASARSSQDSL